jgi:hypothetical protein
MNYYIIIIVLGGMIFLFLPPRYKVFLALFTMLSCFNLVPRIINDSIDVWDVGAVMLMISGVHLFFARPKTEPVHAFYLTVLKIFIVWLWLSLLWALIVYQYPVLNTLKASRQMIIGYMSILVFLRLFRVDPGAFDFIWKAIYWTTFVLLIVGIVQYTLNIRFLYLSQRNYNGAVRSLSFFLPFCLMYFWVIAAKIHAGTPTKRHEQLYLMMAMFITVTTYIRGIYFTVIVIFVAMIVILNMQRRLRLHSAVAFSSALIFIGSLLLVAGYLDRALDRFSSGLTLVASSGEADAGTRRKLDDSYTGRMAMVGDRFDLVVEKNPLFGFAFVHESDVPPEIKARLQHMHGSVVYTPEMIKKYAVGYPYMIALRSADEGWADMLIDTGIVGILLFVVFIFSITADFFKQKISGEGNYYFIRIGLFLQVIAMVFFMFNESSYVASIEIPAFMIAGYAFCTNAERKKNSFQSEPEIIHA